jgi:lysophospholipase L1-like esterase
MMNWKRDRYCVLILALLTAVVGWTASISKADSAPTTAPSADAGNGRSPSDAVTPLPLSSRDKVRHEQFLYRITEGDVGLLFLGDSITDFWPSVGQYSWLKFAPYQPADFGISGEHTEHVLWRINNGELDGIHPKVVVLMIGTNNVGHAPADQPEWAAAGVAKIVEVIREKLPDSKVLLLAVFPRDNPDSEHRDAVQKINEIISKLDDGKMVRYLDIGNVFLDKDGIIPHDIMLDKLHPTVKGYDLWYSAMQPLLDEMMK